MATRKKSGTPVVRPPTDGLAAAFLTRQDVYRRGTTNSRSQRQPFSRQVRVNDQSPFLDFKNTRRRMYFHMGESHPFSIPLSGLVAMPFTGSKPKPTPETKHFWDGCKIGKLLLQRCPDTGRAYFPPRPFSPFTGNRAVSLFEASGRATLHSYVIHHREVPGFTPPYAIAVVELEEGPRMMTNIVECPQTPEALKLNMALQVVFRPVDGEISLPLFRPSKEGA